MLLSDSERLYAGRRVDDLPGQPVSVNWGVFAAGALIGTLPIIVCFLVLQTQIISGLSSGAVKG